MTPLARAYAKGLRTPEATAAFTEYRNELRRKQPKHGFRPYLAGCRCLKCLEAHHHQKYRALKQGAYPKEETP